MDEQTYKTRVIESEFLRPKKLSRFLEGKEALEASKIRFLLPLFRDVSVIIVLDYLQTVLTESGVAYKYDFLCICSGGSPQLISFQQFDGYDFVDHILGIRDTASVAKITQFLSQTKRILLVGNGGIATEFV